MFKERAPNNIEDDGISMHTHEAKTVEMEREEIQPQSSRLGFTHIHQHVLRQTC
jgi:hypothetical protein